MMPGSARNFSGLMPLLAAAGLALLVLPGCSTSKTPGSAADPTGDKPATARGQSAKGGKNTSSGYVDPALVSASSAARASATGIPVDGASDDYPGGGAMAQGVVTQPTGIRAGSVSIFSGAAPASTEPAEYGTMPAATVTGRVDARTGSVFSAPAAPASQYDTQGCGTDADGNPLNC